MLYTQAKQSAGASFAASVLYGLLLSSSQVQAQDSASTKPTLALSRSYKIEQEPIKAFTGLVNADRARALAIGRHKNQTPTAEYYGSSNDGTDDDEEEEPECGDDEEFVKTGTEEAVNLRAAVSFAMAANAAPEPTDVNIRNDITAYLISIGVGEPAQTFPRLLIDTGSANTWVGNNVPYVPTASARNTSLLVGQNYGIGTFRGDEFTDTVTLIGTDGEDLVVKDQGIGIETSSTSFDGLDGILALAPKDQTYLSLKTRQGESLPDLIPTVTDTLFAQGQIPENVVGLSLVPRVSSSGETGLVTFGGVEPSQFNGPIRYFPKAVGDPIKYYWGFDISSVKLDIRDNEDTNTYETLSLLPAPAQGITDSASTLVGLSAPTFQAYMNAIDNAQLLEGGTNFLYFPKDQVERLGNMTFTIGGQDFLFPPAAQVFPNEVAAAILGQDFVNAGLALSVFSNTLFLGDDSFTLGMYFLERYYSVYDTTNARIGFATTDYTFEDTFHDSTSARKTKRAHREHEKKHEWVDGKSRLGSLKARSPFRVSDSNKEKA